MDFLGGLPDIQSTAFTVGAFVLALSIIVFIHELGHYLIGRFSGIQAEVFSIGFGRPLISHEDAYGTRWQIAMIPLGGYVKFLGDADAASGNRDEDVLADLDPETLRHTMHGAPLWARAATVAAGPVFNFILSILVFTGMSMVQGEAVNPPTVANLNPLPTSEFALQPGDTITRIDGKEIEDYASFYAATSDIRIAEELPYSVLRNGDIVELSGPYPFPPIIDTVQPSSAAMDIGLEAGDVITAIDGQPITAFSQLQHVVTESEGRPLVLEIWRDGQTLEFTLAPRRVDLPLSDGGFETRWLIGLNGGLFFEPATKTPSIPDAVTYGAQQTLFIVKSSLSGLYHMATGQISSCNLRGPLGIAETSGAAASQGWLSFIWFIAMLSTAVGLLNLFPIPVLDGGHLMFHVYEAMTGRAPSDTILRVMMAAGLALILALMAFALSNDLFCP